MSMDLSYRRRTWDNPSGMYRRPDPIIHAGSGRTCSLPAGLTPGFDQYRVCNRDDPAVSSSDISTYNAFVTSEANQDSVLSSLGVTWHAIVSTAAVDAKSNAPSLASIPVYDTEGHLLTAVGQSCTCPTFNIH